MVFFQKNSRFLKIARQYDTSNVPNEFLIKSLSLVRYGTSFTKVRENHCNKYEPYYVYISSNIEQQLQLLQGNCSIIMLIDTNIAKATLYLYSKSYIYKRQLIDYFLIQLKLYYTYIAKAIIFYFIFLFISFIDANLQRLFSTP